MRCGRCNAQGQVEIMGDDGKMILVSCPICDGTGERLEPDY